MKPLFLFLLLFTVTLVCGQEKSPLQEQTKDWKTRTVKGREIISPAWQGVTGKRG